MPVPHAVRRMRWEVNVSTEDDAVRIRSRVKNELHGATLAEFDRAFEANVPGADLVHIPTLQIRLALSDVDLPESEIIEMVRSQLASLFAVADGVKVAPSNGVVGSTSSPPRSPQDLLIEYLTSGALAWNLASMEVAAVKEWLAGVAERELALVVNSPAGRTAAGWPEAENTIRYYLRLLEVLDPQTWVKAAHQVSFPSLPEVPASATEAIASLASSGTSQTSLRAAAVVLAAASGGPGSLAVLAGAATRILGDSPPLENLGEPARQWLRAVNRAAPNSPITPVPAPSEAKSEAGRAPALLTDQPAPAAPGLRQPPGVQHRSHVHPEPFGQMVHNAGLILLHPYLPRYLDACGIRPVHTRIPDNALPRAAVLLHLLAGDSAPLDLELGFVKVLLGLEPELPLQLYPATVTDQDRQEAGTLLAAVIGHWNALKSTSTEGLRSSFLTRPGLIEREDSGWRLRMETRGYDLLLDQLPWGFETVRLPWMQLPIFTEWIT